MRPKAQLAGQAAQRQRIARRQLAPPADGGVAGGGYCTPCFSNCGPTRPVCDNAGAPDDWITNVTFNTINNNSDNEPCPCSYGNYTAQSTSVDAGQTYTLSVTFCSEGVWTQYVAAWFDWDQSGTFDASEYYEVGSGVDATVTVDITVPAGAAPGCTGMRVIERYSTWPTDPCEAYSYAECEDYTVCIVVGGACGDPAASGCCVAHGTPGCDDATCCEAICAFRPACCSVVWDDFCAALAAADPVNCPQCQPLPPNDNCQDAVIDTLACDGTLVWTGDTTGATSDCAELGPQVWHAFTISETMDVTIAFCGTTPAFTGFYTVLDQSCPCSGAFVWADGWENTSCGDGNFTLNWFPLGPGTYYYPVISAFGSTGPYTITVTSSNCVAIPPNDDCINAIKVTNADSPIAFSTIGATTDGNVHASCQFDGQTYIDIWYRYSADLGGLLTVTTCEELGGAADYDTDLVVYDGCSPAIPCPPTDAELLACNDDDPANPCGGDPAYHSTVTFPVVAGNCYTIRVGGFTPEDKGTGSLAILPGGACCVWDGSCVGVAFQADCDAQGGAYQGDGTDCATTNCPTTPCWLAKLLASDGAAGDNFGRSVSISGDVAVMGAFWHNVAGWWSGAAYVFQFDGTSWVQKALLASWRASTGARLGDSVSISGDVVVAGADDDDFGDWNTGSVYVFVKPPGGWVDSLGSNGRLIASDANGGDYLGISVSISGDVLVVGAWFDDAPLVNSGSAYLFVKPPGGWAYMTETAKLTASDANGGDYLGISVSISGDVIVVGASGDGFGSAYVFVKPPGGWLDMTQTAKLTASDGATFDEFGTSVSISGDVLVVGAYQYSFGPGSAYVFVKPPGGWVSMTQTAKLTASDGAFGDRFGYSVSLSGDVAVVGAFRDGDNGTDSGSAYVFVSAPSAWVDMTETAKLTAPDGATNERFGYSVSLSGDVAVVGAFLDDDNGTDSGSAYIFGGLSDCNGNGQIDCLDIADGTSTDVNGNGIPDECEGDGTTTTIDGLDDGETVIFSPGGGGLDPTLDPLVEMTNQSGQDGASVTGTVTEGNLNPGAGGYAVFDTQLTITTTLPDGAFFMRVMIPFDEVDLAGADPLSVDLTSYDPIGNAWVLAVQGNTVNSPGHPGPVGDRFAVLDTVLPTPSADLGDYGVYWNPVTLLGFAWANVDHTTDFAAGLAACPADLNGDGVVGFEDLTLLLTSWVAGTTQGDIGGPGGCGVPDGVTDFFDLSCLLAAWAAGGCP